jgi:hypothetical protein
VQDHIELRRQASLRRLRCRLWSSLHG